MTGTIAPDGFIRVVRVELACADTLKLPDVTPTTSALIV
jgi:hypothetical protein